MQSPNRCERWANDDLVKLNGPEGMPQERRQAESSVARTRTARSGSFRYAV